MNKQKFIILILFLILIITFPIYIIFSYKEITGTITDITDTTITIKNNENKLQTFKIKNAPFVLNSKVSIKHKNNKI